MPISLDLIMLYKALILVIIIQDFTHNLIPNN